MTIHPFEIFFIPLFGIFDVFTQKTCFIAQSKRISFVPAFSLIFHAFWPQNVRISSLWKASWFLAQSMLFFGLSMVGSCENVRRSRNILKKWIPIRPPYTSYISKGNFSMIELVIFALDVGFVIHSITENEHVKRPCTFHSVVEVFIIPLLCIAKWDPIQELWETRSTCNLPLKLPKGNNDTFLRESGTKNWFGFGARITHTAIAN